MTEKCKFKWVLKMKNAKISGFLPNLRTKVLNMIKTSVLVLLSGLFDRSRSRTVTALPFRQQIAVVTAIQPGELPKSEST